jgi:hypothetical protein
LLNGAVDILKATRMEVKVWSKRAEGLKGDARSRYIQYRSETRQEKQRRRPCRGKQRRPDLAAVEYMLAGYNSLATS